MHPTFIHIIGQNTIEVPRIPTKVELYKKIKKNKKIRARGKEWKGNKEMANDVAECIVHHMKAQTERDLQERCDDFDIRIDVLFQGSIRRRAWCTSS